MSYEQPLRLSSKDSSTPRLCFYLSLVGALCLFRSRQVRRPCQAQLASYRKTLDEIATCAGVANKRVGIKCFVRGGGEAGIDTQVDPANGRCLRAVLSTPSPEILHGSNKR